MNIQIEFRNSISLGRPCDDHSGHRKCRMPSIFSKRFFGHLNPITHYFRLFVLALTLASQQANAQPDQAWLNLLRRADFSQLEAQTTALQRRFAAAEATEFDLRQAYRPFYNLTDQDLLKLDAWQKTHPKSYAVRLIRGTYYKRAGFSARGGDVAARTPPENFSAMRELHAIAVPQLEESLSLTDSPYLSVFHLLDLRIGNRPIQRALLESGTKMLPANSLIRARYMRGLTPRWGGSYEAMWAFFAEAKRTGATEHGLFELEAIISDDAGDTDLERGNRAGAIRNFRKALELGAKVGGDVPRELSYSWHYRCKFPELADYCR